MNYLNSTICLFPSPEEGTGGRLCRWETRQQGAVQAFLHCHHREGLSFLSTYLSARRRNACMQTRLHPHPGPPHPRMHATNSGRTLYHHH